ncbi:PstS family phosphate ABC transporter substrate-binding protein [Natronospora cellulosivora (SeqCode)]
MLIKKVVLVFSILVLMFFVVGCDNTEQSNIEVRGSDTMVNLGQRLAEAYMENNDQVSISVTGGGSGTGIAAMIDNRVDIANSSRDMSDTEIRQARDNGVEPVEIAIAMDGLAVFVNDSIPISELTMDQVGAIFRGDISNWSELGGPDRTISMYGRQSNSGTFVYFREAVLKADFSDAVKRMNGTAQIIEGVINDNAAIGYGGIGYTVDDDQVVDGLRVLKIAVDENSEAASPLVAANVESGAYPIARPLFNYTNGIPEGEILDYILFIIAEQGQETAVNAGFYPINPEYRAQNNQTLGL